MIDLDVRGIGSTLAGETCFLNLASSFGRLITMFGPVGCGSNFLSLPIL